MFLEIWRPPWAFSRSDVNHGDVEAQEKFLCYSGDEAGDDIDLSDPGLSTDLPNAERRLKRTSDSLMILTAINVLILCVTVYLYHNQAFQRRWLTKNSCIRKTSAYSPIFDEKTIEHTDVYLNGSLWPGRNPSWSRQPPGDKEAEAVWESFELVDTFPITRQQVVAMGKDPETVAKYPDEYWGMGDDAYIASLDIQHKVHCLNELRAMTFADYGITTTTKPIKQHGKLWWIHLRHCVDMLTQDLLCHADADLVTYNWRDTQNYPFPDFSINRKCRSVQPLFEYRDAHKVNMDKYMAMKKPAEGINQLPFEPGYYAMFGFEGSDLFPDGRGYDQELPDTSQWFGGEVNVTKVDPLDHSRESRMSE